MSLESCRLRQKGRNPGYACRRIFIVVVRRESALIPPGHNPFPSSEAGQRTGTRNTSSAAARIVRSEGNRPADLRETGFRSCRDSAALRAANTEARFVPVLTQPGYSPAARNSRHRTSIKAPKVKAQRISPDRINFIKSVWLTQRNDSMASAACSSPSA